MTVREILAEAETKIKQTTGANVVNISYKLAYEDGIIPGSPIAKLKDIISDITGIQWPTIMEKTRVKEVVEARQLFCYFATDVIGMPLVTIARILKRDHTTVLFGRNKVRDLIYIKDDRILEKINLINEIRTQPS